MHDRGSEFEGHFHGCISSLVMTKDKAGQRRDKTPVCLSMVTRPLCERQFKDAERELEHARPTATPFQKVPHGAAFSPSHRTTQLPSWGKPGALVLGQPSHPAAIIATA